MSGPEISLRWKVSLSVSLLLIAVSGAVAIALIRYERLFLTREGDKRVRALAESLALSARDPLLVGDELRLGPIVQSAIQDEDALFAYLVDHRGEIVSHSGREASERASDGDPPGPKRGVLQATAGVVVEGTEIGKAVVGLDAGFVDDAMRVTAIGLLLPLAVGTLAGLAGVFVLTGIHVRRIETLERAVRAVGEGDMLVQASVDSRDEVGRLAAHFNTMVARLDSSRRQIESGFMETVSSLAAAIEAKDRYTRGHCDRVARMSRAIAQRLSVNGTDLRNLELAAILHDIGKIGVSAEIIGKAGRLTDAELESMQQHPDIGARILAPLSSLGDVATYVRHHHEHYDGSGYPEGLAGDDIPVQARIIHLVDAYDAMTTSRPYRAALSHEEAVERIAADKGGQFDPRLVELFLELEQAGVIADIREQVAEAAGR